jgi:hypothetical protein
MPFDRDGFMARLDELHREVREEVSRRVQELTDDCEVIARLRDELRGATREQWDVRAEAFRKRCETLLAEL